MTRRVRESGMFGSSGTRARYDCVEGVRRVSARLKVLVAVLVARVVGMLGFSGVGSALAATHRHRVAVRGGGRH
jgi:hypothetical protein